MKRSVCLDVNSDYDNHELGVGEYLCVFRVTFLCWPCNIEQHSCVGLVTSSNTNIVVLCETLVSSVAF